MTNTSSKTKFYTTIVSILLLFTTLGVAIFFIVVEIKYLSSKYSNIKQDAINTQDKINQISEIEREYNNIKDSMARIDGALTDNKRFLDVIMRLEKIAEETNNVSEITIVDSDRQKKDSQSKTSANFIKFRVVIRGLFSNAILFINSLENADFYNRIDKIEMVKNIELPTQATTKENSLGDIKTTLEVKIFTN